MLDIITKIPYGSIFFPVRFSNGFHHYGTITRSRSSCFVTNSSPSPLLVSNTSANRKVAGPKNHETTSATSRGALEDAHPEFPNNTVGIIGGMSTGCTLHFLQKFVELSSHGEGQVIPFIVCNDTIPDIKNSTQGKLIVEMLRERKVFLEKCGANCTVMPCHSLQLTHEEIGSDSKVPFLNISDCVVKELKAAKLKPIEAGSNVRIGILSTGSSLSTIIYQEKLENEGFEVIYPDKATMDHVVLPAARAYERKDMKGATNLLTIAIQVLLVKAVNIVIFASHDLAQILSQDDPLLQYCIDPIESLAKETVRRAKSVDTENI